MEGAESGVVVPSVLEAETWVKLCNLPAEFLNVDDISLIVSSFASPVGMDEDTAEKVENHKKPPNLRRKLHSRKTFVTICVRISVTKPLPSLVAVGSKKGREYIIRLDFEPTPKVCLLCLGAGHFDFECCSTDKESVEIIAEAGGGFDGFCADSHGEQGAVSTDGLHSYEDATVVEAALMVDSHFLPAASCEFGAAATPELMPLLPAFDHEIQGTLFTEGSGSYADHPVLNVDPLISPHAPGIFGADATDLLPKGPVLTQGPVSCEDPHELAIDPSYLSPATCTYGAAVLQPEMGELAAMQTISDGFDVSSSGEKIAAVLLSGVFHKWRDFTDDQGLLEDGSGTGVGFLGVDMQDVDCLRGIGGFIDGVHGAVTIDRAEFHVLSPVVEADLAENFLIIEQLFSVVNSPRKHHKWRDKSALLGLWCDILAEKGMLSFDKLDLLQKLSTLVWFLAVTYYEQVCFKIHHKWRDKGF